MCTIIICSARNADIITTHFLENIPHAWACICQPPISALCDPTVQVLRVGCIIAARNSLCNVMVQMVVLYNACSSRQFTIFYLNTLCVFSIISVAINMGKAVHSFHHTTLQCVWSSDFYSWDNLRPTTTLE